MGISRLLLYFLVNPLAKPPMLAGMKAMSRRVVRHKNEKLRLSFTNCDVCAKLTA